MSHDGGLIDTDEDIIDDSKNDTINPDAAESNRNSIEGGH